MSETQKYNFMKNTLKLSVIAALVALLSGCGEDLKPKVAALEAELAKEKAALVVANAELVKEKAALVATNAELAKEKAALVVANAELAKEKVALVVSNAALAKEKAALVAANEEFAREKAAFSVVAAKIALAEKLEADKKAESDKKGSLTVQLGLTMRSGDTKPVSNTKVYLTRKNTSVILSSIEAKNDYGAKISLKVVEVLSSAGELLGYYSKMVSEVESRLKVESLAIVDSDFNGSATFEDIAKGDYYVICFTRLGGGAVLEKQITISTSKAKVALSNADSLE